MTGRRLSEAEVVELVRLRREGKTIGEIGEIIGVSSVAVYKRLANMGFHTRYSRTRSGPIKPATVSDRAHPIVRQIVERSNQMGITQHQLGIRSGVDVDTLRRWRGGGAPNTMMLDACAQVVGLRLTAVPMAEAAE